MSLHEPVEGSAAGSDSAGPSEHAANVPAKVARIPSSDMEKMKKTLREGYSKEAAGIGPSLIVRKRFMRPSVWSLDGFLNTI